MAVKASGSITLIRVNDGASGKGIKSYDVEYYLSTSSTSITGGSWVTTAPEWVSGKYIWSRNRITYTDNTVTVTAAVCITGGKGDTGGPGETGTGISSITEEYYLSTSKTSQTGGSWVTTPPTWSVGKYMWTRIKIVYTNPSSTKYTTPICDSSWEAIDEIKIEGKNLALSSKYEIDIGAKYKILQGTLSEPWIVGETYTILVKGATINKNDMFSGLGLWRDGGSTTVDTSIWYNEDKKLYILTFKCPVAHSTDTTLNEFSLYNYPSASAVSAKVDWVKIVRGNKFSYDWAPAPEDVDDKFEGVGDSISDIVKDYTSAISKEKENIKLEVSEKYYSKEDTDKIIGEVGTTFNLYKEGIDIEFKSQKDDIGKLEDGLTSETKTRNSLIRLVDGNIILGLEGSTITLVERNDRISFMENGTLEVAYFSNGKLYVKDGEFTNSLRIGKFAFVPRTNGSLDFKKVE